MTALAACEAEFRKAVTRRDQAAALVAEHLEAAVHAEQARDKAAEDIDLLLEQRNRLTKL